jgi:hypothetical protein
MDYRSDCMYVTTACLLSVLGLAACTEATEPDSSEATLAIQNVSVSPKDYVRIFFGSTLACRHRLSSPEATGCNANVQRSFSATKSDGLLSSTAAPRYPISLAAAMERETDARCSIFDSKILSVCLHPI